MVAQWSRFYNLPSDGQGYPKFTSFKDRRNYIKSSILFSEERIEFFRNLVMEESEREQQRDETLKAQIAYQENDMAKHQAQIEEDENLDLGKFDKVDRENNGKEGSSQLITKFEDHMKCSRVVFVGDSTISFSPYRGDLIIHQTGRAQEFPGRSYLASYEGPHTRILDGDLVVRIGQYDEVRHSKGLFVHKPYETLELYKLEMGGTWQYLGSQVNMTDREIDVDTSPGKYLNVGAHVGSYGKFLPLVPRRGDIIIKEEAMRDDFLHEENFWHSMVKWHRGSEVIWNPGNLLLRLFVDKERKPSYSYDHAYTTPEPGDHSACHLHGKCEKSHPPPSAGFVELYQKGQDVSHENGQNVSQWTYWGRTKLLFDIVPEKQSYPHLLFYTEDDGQYSDFHMEETSIQNPWLIK